jgi:hypothetical protein
MVRETTAMIWAIGTIIVVLTMMFPLTRKAVRFLLTAVYDWMAQWFWKRTDPKIRQNPDSPTS